MRNGQSLQSLLDAPVIVARLFQGLGEAHRRHEAASSRGLPGKGDPSFLHRRARVEAPRVQGEEADPVPQRGGRNLVQEVRVGWLDPEEEGEVVAFETVDPAQAGSGGPVSPIEELQAAADFDPKPQGELLLEGGPKGRFEGEEPNLVEGEDLDIPPFLRRKK